MSPNTTGTFLPAALAAARAFTSSSSRRTVSGDRSPTHCLRLNWWIKISLFPLSWEEEPSVLRSSSQRRFTQEPPFLRLRGLFQTDGVAGGVAAAAVVTPESRKNVLLVG